MILPPLFSAAYVEEMESIKKKEKEMGLQIKEKENEIGIKIGGRG